MPAASVTVNGRPITLASARVVAETGRLEATFDGEPLYRPGLAPSAEEVERRRKMYFQPYHQALAEEMGARFEQIKRDAGFGDA